VFLGLVLELGINIYKHNHLKTSISSYAYGQEDPKEESQEGKYNLEGKIDRHVG